MRVAQADQELIIKQRISILGCQIWSGFVFWWERWEQPEAFFWNLGGTWFHDVSYFISKHPGRASPDVWMGRNSKAITKASGLRVQHQYASMQHDLNISKGSCPGLRQESYTRGFAKGFCHGFYCPKTCPKLRQGVVPRGYSTLFDGFYKKISKFSVNLTMPTSRYMRSRARALFNWDMNGQTVQRC